MRTWLYACHLSVDGLLTLRVSMTTLSHAEHTVRRKAYASHYNPAHLSQFQPEIIDSVAKVVQVSTTSM